jgi:transcription elongation factor S-II
MEILNPSRFRANVRDNLMKIIDNEKKSTNLERAIFNYALQEAQMRKEVKKWENPRFVQLYNDRLWTIFVNLKNKNILQSIHNDELLPQTFAFMTHQEMDPDHWKELLDKKRMLDQNSDTTLVANTDMFTCSKCKSKNCNYYTMQTRSADEPETIFITCIDCGKHWKS